MSWGGKTMDPRFENIEQISADDVRSWIGVISESTTIEFKREPYKFGDTREWRKDISAMANAEGGCIVLGIAAEDGLASSIVGIPSDSVDRVMLWLEQSADSGIKQRILRKIRPISIGADSSVVLCATPRSTIGPHRLEPENRFYRRTSTNVVEMDLEQLRRAFLGGNDAIEVVDAVHRSRLSYPKPGSAPLMRITAAPVPFGVERFNPGIPKHVEAARQLSQNVAGGSVQFHFDGVRMQAGMNMSARVFRSGVVQIDSPVVSEYSRDYTAEGLVARLVLDLHSASRLINGLPYDGQVAYQMSMLGMRGQKMKDACGFPGEQVQDDELHFPTIVMERARSLP